MKTLLEVKNLHKSYENVQVLKDVDLTVGQDDFVAIMGRSGSGKSTLLYCISGMDQPDSGEVYFGGERITGLDDDQMSSMRLKRMGFIFQHSFLLKKLSVLDNIVLPGFRAGVLPKAQVQSDAEMLMQKTGISEVAKKDTRKVSGGQLQRAAICRALINKPDILFGDEPTGALNSSTTREVMDILNNVNDDGTAIVLVTHDAKVAARADRVIFLVDGSVHDELTLGKYGRDEKEQSTRERRLSDWLETHGF